MIELRPAKAEELPALRGLWRTAFGDEDGYIDAFYFLCAGPGDALVLLEDGVFSSMLTLLPVTLALPGGADLPAAYVYAVATEPRRRGKGLARTLLQYADFYLREHGVFCAVTVPAEEGLWAYYAASGFQDFFVTGFRTLDAAALPPPTPRAEVEELTPTDYGACRRALLAAVCRVEYSEKFLSFQQYACRASGGGLYGFRVDGAPCCAAAEYRDEHTLVCKELLCPPGRTEQALAELSARLPARRLLVRAPVCMGGGAYERRGFAAVKWLGGTGSEPWNGLDGGYLGLALD